jgi:hypothetical protein
VSDLNTETLVSLGSRLNHVCVVGGGFCDRDAGRRGSS